MLNFRLLSTTLPPIQPHAHASTARVRVRTLACTHLCHRPALCRSESAEVTPSLKAVLAAAAGDWDPLIGAVMAECERWHERHKQ